MKNEMELGGYYGSALCAACANGQNEVVKMLLNRGASIQVASK
jgi:ankyrin repeat protein